MLGKILLAIIYPAGPLQPALNACNEVSKKPRTSAEYPAKCASYFLVDKQVSASDIVMKSLYFTFICPSPQYCFVNQIKNLMFTWGLNKFYCNSLCDRFKIISPTKTWYQTPEKVAQIQGQDDKFLAKTRHSYRVSGEFILIETKGGKLRFV